MPSQDLRTKLYAIVGAILSKDDRRVTDLSTALLASLSRTTYAARPVTDLGVSLAGLEGLVRTGRYDAACEFIDRLDREWSRAERKARRLAAIADCARRLNRP